MNTDSTLRMLIIVLLSVCLNILTTPCFAQCEGNCLPDGIFFETQEQIDDFSINYPGCSVIEGDVIIGTEIENLFGLESLEQISGTLNIEKNVKLDSFQGLHNIDVIGGDLHLYWSYVENLSGFDELDTIYGDFFMDYFGDLTSLSGINNLKYVGGDFYMDDNELIAFSALSSLTYVGGDFSLSHVDVRHMGGLGALKEIGGNFSVYSMPKLESFIGLFSLERVGGLIINDDYHDYSFNGLDSLHYINGDFYYNGSVNNSFHGLSGLDSIAGDFHLYYNHAVWDFTGLSNLKVIGGDLKFSRGEFSSLEGLENLERIGGDFYIWGTHVYSSYFSFENLSTIEGSVHISGMYDDSFYNLDFFNSLDSIGGSELLITHCYGLYDISALADVMLDNVDTVIIEGNCLLSNCSIESICNIINDTNVYFEISDNHYQNEGCNSVEEVRATCHYLGDDEIEVDGFTVSPNPCIDELVISSKDIENFCYCVFDDNGKMITEGESLASLVILNTSHWDSGIYFALISSSKQESRIKVIKP